MKISVPAMVLSALTLSACATPGAPTRPQALVVSGRNPVLTAVQALAVKADSASLATAALLADVPAHSVDVASARLLRSYRLSLSEHAARLSSDQPMYLWAQLQLCRQSEACDATAVERRLQDADSDNAASWLTSLEEAEHSGDVQAVDAALQRMSEARQFNEYWDSLAVAVYGALSRDAASLPNPWRQQTPFDRLAAALALANITIVPPTALRVACSVMPLPAPRLAACSALTRTLQRADTMLLQEAGFELAQTLPGSALDAASSSPSYRAFEWRRRQPAIEANQDLRALNHAAEQRLELMRRLHREDDVVMALLTARHIPLEPPPDWSPAPPGAK